MATDDDTTNLQQVFNPITPATYTQEQLQEMKALGLPKPDDVTWGDWMGPKKESYVHEALIYMAASGANQKQIATDLGYTQSRISIILSKPDIRKKIRAIQEQLWGDNAEKRFKHLLPRAIDVAENILEDQTAKQNLKADVAFKLMDRALGKPQQSVSVEGNLLADLIHRLDQQETRDVSQTALQSKPSDEAEQSIDEFLGEETFTVGKRGEDGKGT
jgi:hypothetical protein